MVVVVVIREVWEGMVVVEVDVYLRWKDGRMFFRGCMGYGRSVGARIMHLFGHDRLG